LCTRSRSSSKLNSWSQIALKPFNNYYLHKQDLGQAEGEKAYIPNLKNGDHSMMISDFARIASVYLQI
jgi:hypothetical protein